MRTPVIQFLCFFLFLGFYGCTNSTPTPAVDPMSNSGQFRLLPNDPVSNDSAAVHLAEGVIIPAFPGAAYELSFISSDTSSAPDLRLYRLIPQGNAYAYTNDQVVKAKRSAGRWVYSFTCTLAGTANWITVLEQKGKRFSGTLSSLTLTATGNQSNHFSIVLWLTGQYVSPDSGQSSDQLAKALLAEFRAVYGPAGIVVDSIYVRKATSHPIVGGNYSDKVKVISTGLESRFDSLGYGLTGVEASALDLVLVTAFSETGLLGESPLFGLSLEAGESGFVVIATERRSDTGTGYIQVGAEDIVTTAVHEVGHFFGLRHTTATTRDMQSAGDYSLTEDGLRDTPWCLGLNALVGDRFNIQSTHGTLARHWLVGLSSALACPDANNLMFPYAVSGSLDTLSPEQGAMLLKTLRLFPH